MNYKAVIFDMDGTIIATEQLWQKANALLLNEQGINCTIDEINLLQEHMHGLSVHDCCLFLKMKFNLNADISMLIEQKNKLAMDLFERELQFVEGFTDFHSLLISKNIKTAIATNANDKTLTTTNKILNLKSYFNHHIYGISCVQKGKPDPALFLYAAEKLETNPNECLVIEDSAHGIQAAKKAGMTCIGINTAKNPKTLAQADYIVNYYHEIDFL